MNIDNIVEYTTLLNPDEISTISRTNGFFKRIGNLFKRVRTAVVTVISTAFLATVGAVAGFFAGGIPGAIIGGIVGFSVGLELAFYISCENGLSQDICLDCKEAYPNANIYNC